MDTSRYGLATALPSAITAALDAPVEPPVPRRRQQRRQQARQQWRAAVADAAVGAPTPIVVRHWLVIQTSWRRCAVVARQSPEVRALCFDGGWMLKSCE